MIALPVEGIRINLPLVTPSQNVYQRWHWARRGAFRDELQLMVRVCLRNMGCVQAPSPVRAVVRVIRRGARPLDYGNLVGGAKPLLDSLVRERVIHDDSPRWVEEMYLQERAARGHESTRIWVYPAIERHSESW